MSISKEPGSLSLLMERVRPFASGNRGNFYQEVIDGRWISKEESGTIATENPHAKYPRLELWLQRQQQPQLILLAAQWVLTAFENAGSGLHTAQKDRK